MSQNKQEFILQLDRVYQATCTRTQSELAEYLGVCQPSVSDAKRRKRIPPEWLLKLLRLSGVHPDWVLTGKGPRYLVSQSLGEDEAFALRSFSSQALADELLRRAERSS